MPPSGGPSDVEFADLLARVRAGDIHAFQQLFHAWFPSLVTLAYHYVGSAETAKDITQDVFIDFWNGREQWKWDGEPYRYFTLLVRRKSLNVIRRIEVEVRYGAAFLDEQVSPTSGTVGRQPDEALIYREFWNAVAAAIRALPPRMRAVALLRWFEGAGRNEAATELEVSVRTIDAQLAAAAKIIRQRLEQGGFDPP